LWTVYNLPNVRLFRASVDRQRTVPCRGTVVDSRPGWTPTLAARRRRAARACLRFGGSGARTRSRRTSRFTDVSRTITFPDRRFPDKTFPGQTFSGQVILRNFQVHNVCKYQLYRPSQTICMYTERLLMLVIQIARETSVRERSVRENDCPGNVLYAK